MRGPRENTRLDVSVVIPAHNEEGNIGPLMDQFAELAKGSRFNFEVVLVDDGSTDRTLARATDVQKNHRFIRLVSLPYRRGLTEALRAGFAAAGEAVAEADPQGLAVGLEAHRSSMNSRRMTH